MNRLTLAVLALIGLAAWGQQGAFWAGHSLGMMEASADIRAVLNGSANSDQKEPK